ncbi:TetR/AcrR family transcriptional regulator [Dietzia psychralcaliphila]|uniref:TetR family transcriptional regulator n=1 Tax=Dietzia psychralcaliphila TaxID=139021 RepID=A0AAD0NNV4_9ACTN|nr:TetR/AcrR family transcriptional regulator [Dietzia psychralcaliphila]AWH96311.1 TetR family transcriptional regulator [Dietzia psychralcaliphila]PTM90592.1 TetR family transcriptional regulator [Dietzia psychralcaliphila]
MTRPLPEYHQKVAATNRTAILDAATALFLDSGYDRTSLSRVAADAGVSKATLFKQFATKAQLFETAVLAAGGPRGREVIDPPAGNFSEGLVDLGCTYAELLRRPQMIALMRVLVAESPRFPELRERTFDFGTLPVLSALRRFLEAQDDAGTATIDDPDVASSQFLGMIATTVFWPYLVHGDWSLTEAEVRKVVDEAARTITARYASPSS